MRTLVALALVALPATAFAQTAVGPTTAIPVHRCEPTQDGVICGPVRDGAGFAAASGYIDAPTWRNTLPHAYAAARANGNQPKVP